MAEERRLIIPGILDRVPEACDFVVRAAESAGLDERAVYHCQMAVDEWCTNIIEHGFDHEGARGRIEIVCKENAEKFVIRISDDSPAFDPRNLAEVDPSKPLEERQPGGLGWFFIKKLMDELDYQHKDGRNNLTMVKLGVQPHTAGKPVEDKQFPSHEWRDGIYVIAPQARLDSTIARQWEAAFTNQIDAGHHFIIVDMSGVNYISSSGLKVIIAARRQVQKFNGNITLSGLSLRVREIFEMSGFDALFYIASSVDEAGEHLITHRTKT